ncbi:hypothetical protein F503_04330 [Ophiostoma piceae UAMH 11346]|uniref:A-kinase anchor protein 7-like phosphoesterase domain-containing protein n=1 Tax=Ophiostoma piceae (strain UAMH 11346) TaxID=1262450 RepID=S3CQ89_OPHP1|nr:hypothetical protein F503_04330 [Ophiostoma piceae UAMH 11346]
MQARRPPRPQLTHFLCIPLATPAGRPQLVNSLATFHADVAATTVSMTSGSTGGANSANDRNATTKRGFLPRQALRPVGTLHLTLGTLSLEGDRLTQAIERLATLAPKAPTPTGTTTTTPSIGLRGLNSMQPPARSSVLYASPVDKSTGRLAAAGGPFLELCERVRAIFSDLMIEDGRPLLLHATIVNTVYVGSGGRGGRGGRGGGRGGRGGHGGGRGGGKITFDARDLIEQYEDFLWMDNVPTKKVALCRMGAQTTAMDDDGEVIDAAYPVEAEVLI